LDFYFFGLRLEKEIRIEIIMVIPNRTKG